MILAWRFQDFRDSAEYGHWCELRLPHLEESGVSSAHFMSPTQREPIISLLLHCKSCTIEAMTIIARENILTENINILLNIGAISEEKTSPH